MVGYNESEGKSDSSSTSRPSSPQELMAYYKAIDKATGGHKEWEDVPVYNKKGKPVVYKKGPNKGEQKTKRKEVYQKGRLGQFAEGGSDQVEYQADNTQVDYQPVQSSLTYTPMRRDVNYQADTSNLSYAPDKTRVNYQALTPAQLRALGGAGASRELAAQRSYDATAEQIAADPRMSVYQSARGRQLAGRDLADSLDAIKKESEAGITDLAQKQNELTYAAGTDNRAYLADQAAKAFQSQQQNREFKAGERGKAYESAVGNRTFAADQAGKGYESRVADRAFLADQLAKEYEANKGNRDYAAAERGRAYDASVRNADLTRDDLLALAQLYFGGKGQYTTSTTKQRSSSAGGNLL